MSEQRVIAGRYRLDRVLGQGAMGQVWLGYDLLIHRTVAIKQVLAAADPTTRERALREAQAAGRMHHMNAVSVYDLVMLDGLPWVVMEYVAGDSLADRLRAGTLPAHAVADVCGQVAAALSAAHRMGIVHRDVKPANILIDAEGTAKLADFGIARMETAPDLTGTGFFVGTVSFLAPEVVTGAEVTAAADVWSLGATMFTALEGRPVFTGPNSYAIIAALAQAPVPSPTRAGPLSGLLGRMLSRDPAARPPAEQVRAELEPLRAARTTRAAVPPPPPPPARPPAAAAGAGPGPYSANWPTQVTPQRPGAPRPRGRRRAALIAAAVVVLAAAAAGIGFALESGGSSSPPRKATTTGVSTQVASGNGENNPIASVRWGSSDGTLTVLVRMLSNTQPGSYELSVEFDTDNDASNHCDGIDSFIVWDSKSEDTTRRVVHGCPLHGSGSFTADPSYPNAYTQGSDTVQFTIPYYDELPSAGHVVGLAVEKRQLPADSSAPFSVLPGSGSSRDGTLPVRLR